MEKGRLIVLSGPSGAGKGTVVKELRKVYSNLAFSVSVTTRQPRDGEINGVNYHFKTLDEYKEILDSEYIYYPIQTENKRQVQIYSR